MNVLALTFIDTFNDNSLDTFWWTAVTSGGSTIAEVNNRIEMTQGSSGAATLKFNVSLTGDFTIITDYQLLNWPSNNKERIGIINTFSTFTGAVERISDSGFGGEVYLTHFGPDGVRGRIATTDTNGKLKFERIGSTLSGYYYNGSGWTLIRSYTNATNNTSDALTALQIWPASPVHSGVKVAFDNFYLNAPSTDGPAAVPEPASLFLLGIGLAGIAGSKLRRKS